MPLCVNKIKIFVASPGDVEIERRTLEAVIKELNSTIAPEKNIVLELVRWETHCHPSMGRPQEVINRQIARYDIFLGIMWKRFGSPTGIADSGTEEEFSSAYTTWLKHNSPRIMFYFCQAPFMPRNAKDIEQLSKVLSFRQELQKKGLTWNYADSQTFANTIRPHLVRTLIEVSQQLSEACDFSPSSTQQHLPKPSTALIKDYLSILTSDLSSWRGLSLTRDVRLEDIYVTHLLQTIESEDDLISDKDLLARLTVEEPEAHRILILGSAGSGKSTLLKHCALKLALRPCVLGAKEFVPFYLPLGLLENLPGCNGSWNSTVVQLLAAMFSDANGMVSRELVASFIDIVNSGHAIIFLDAADEVSEESRRYWRKWYNILRTNAKRCPIVLTSRPSEYVSGIENLDVFYLRTFKAQ